ncbi:MAG: serine/threonine-protein phosphatase [Spirochaetes bacterium]|nr:serine/threonine-protein phosphatase [Spirochaetota bacterium]
MITGLVLFDVSGHGVSSGLITTLVRPILYRTFTADPSVALKDIITTANRIIKAKGDVDNYLTCVMLRFAGTEVHYINAGHPDIIKKDITSVAPVIPSGMPVQGAFMGYEGMIEFFEESSREHRFAMKRNDVLVLFTDCLAETKSSDGSEFGISGISRVLSDAPQTVTASELLGCIVAAHTAHRGSAPLTDDLTILVIKVREGAE